MADFGFALVLIHGESRGLIEASTSAPPSRRCRSLIHGESRGLIEARVSAIAAKLSATSLIHGESRGLIEAVLPSVVVLLRDGVDPRRKPWPH